MKLEERGMDRDRLLGRFDDRHALFGLFFAFGNRLQSAGDSFYEEITCKQFFLLVCLQLFGEETPTVNELAEVMGSSHQNVKQLVNKLEREGFVAVCPDREDRRKLRIVKADRMQELAEKYMEKEEAFMEQLYAGVGEDELHITYGSMLRIEKNLIRMKEEHENEADDCSILQ